MTVVVRATTTLAAMGRPWFKCQPVDETFFDTAPLLLREEFEILRPAAQVWDELTAEGTLAWCRILQDVSWTSPRPFGVDTTRTARALWGANILKERFFRWEEGSRKSFAVVEATTPLARRFAEDYLVEPTSEASCRFTWTIAVEPQPAARIADPVNKMILRTLFRDTRTHTGCADEDRRGGIGGRRRDADGAARPAGRGAGGPRSAPSSSTSIPAARSRTGSGWR